MQEAELKGKVSETSSIYQTLVEELPLPVALYTGREMRVTQVNDALLKVWGKDSSVIGKTFRQALPELEGQPFYQLLDDVFTTGIPYHAKEDRVDLMIEGELRTFYFNFTYKPLKNSAGEVWGILNTASDVTELVLTRKSLAEARESLQFALTAAELGTWDFDPSNNIIKWDERCRELFGFDKGEEVLYADALNYVHPDDENAVNTAVNNSLDRNGSGKYDIKFRTLDAKHQVRWLRCQGRAFFDGDVPYRFAGTAQDISQDVESQKEQQKFRTLVENSGDLIGVTDLEGNVTYLNKFGQELTGLHSFEEYHRPSSDFLAKEDMERLSAEMASSMSNQGRWKGDIRYRNFKTGELIPCYISAFFLHDPETNEPIAMASVTRDLRAETESRKQQQKLISLVENSADLMSVLEPTGFNSYLNKAGKQLLGFDSDEEVFATPITNLHQPEDLEFVQREVLPSLQKHGRWSGKMHVKHLKTGEVFPVFNSTVAIKDPVSGEMLAAGALMRDMRPELAAQQALADSERLFRYIATAAPTGLWMADENMNVTFVNEIWVNWTGKSFDEHLKSGWLDCVVDEDRERAEHGFRDDFGERRKHEIHLRIKSPESGIKWVICTGNPQYSNNGEFKGYIGACVDITELKQLQRQKDDFLGIASHELKTPVTSIKAYAQVLELMFRDSGDEKKAGMVRKMDVQVNKLTTLIGDLLDVTKIHTGKLQFNDSQFDFNELAKELVEELQRTTKRHTIVEQFAEAGMVYADRERIGQVITNLISNAIKYSPNADKIIVFTERNGEFVRLGVQDFGIGIPADKTDRVFEQFYRVSGDKQHTYPGLGLGLYISGEIVKRHSGTFSVNSTEGEGSTFCFSLPA